MKKKVLIAAGLFPPDIGGPATYAAMVCERLPEKGFEVSVMPYGAVRTVPKLFRHLTYAWRLWRMSKSVDIIYALDPMSVGWPALLVSRLRYCDLVVRLGGDYAWEQGVQRFGVEDTLDEYSQKPDSYDWRVRMFATLQRAVVKRAKLVIVPSLYLKSIVDNWSGVDGKKVVVVYSALFPLKVNDSKSVLRDQLEYDTFTIFSAGRLVPWKGMVKLVEALSLILESGQDAQLVIAGGGPETESIKMKAKELNISDKVRLVGPLSKEALGASLCAADVFALNTAYEGLSHQLLEVMDLGVPIVTTNVGGNPELIQQGVSGSMVEFDDVKSMADSLKQIASSNSLADRYVQHARIKVKDFSQDQSVKKLASLLQQIN